MTTLKRPSARWCLVPSVIAALSLSTLALSACASKPDRRGPPPEDRRAGSAQSSGTFLHPVAALFISLDQDGDKRTSRAELADGIAAEWARFDRNPSAVTFTPWLEQTFGSAYAMPSFISFDQDFNGVITEAEFAARLEKDFTRYDKDSDGLLSRTEMIVAFAAPQGQRSRDSGQGSRPERGGRSERGGGGGRPQR